jgi:hypothetical protein
MSIPSDRVHSTPPTNTSAINPSSSAEASRRGFLVQAAGVAAGGAALGAGLPLPAPAGTSQEVPDAILAAIENHKAAHRSLTEMVHIQFDLEELLPSDKQQSHIDAWDENIVATDDPRWIESERALRAAYDAEMDAAIELVTVLPTTAAGMLALLEYAISADHDGELWPTELQSDDGKRTRSWHHFLIENLSEILPRFVLA